MISKSELDAIDDPRVDEIIAAYLVAIDAGQAPARDEWLARHPELADELRDCFDAMDEVQRLSQPLRPCPAPAIDNATPLGEPPTSPQSSFLDSCSTYRTLPERFGNYELLDEVARGGMGVVYKARQVSLNRVVALKMILAGQLAHPEDVLRFRAEAEAAARLQHPNIVAIHEVGEHNGQYFFSMDFIEGVSLAESIRTASFPVRVAARLVQTIADAVHYAHQRGILHRDLKPSNILLQGGLGSRDQGLGHEDDRRSPSGPQPLTLDARPPAGPHVPKITDFGLAKRIEGGSDLTGTGQILGTPGYMPPEQAAARHSEIGPASDVYALGAILYELVTGRPPFRADSPLDTLMQVLEAEPLSPRLLNRAVPRDLETICLKCLEKEPRRRYESAQQLAQDLERFSIGEPIVARAVSLPERAWRWCLRRPGWAAMIAVSLLAALLLCGGSLWFMGQLHRELARTEEKQHELQLALARQVAERLDSDLRQLASVPSTLARLLAERSDWTIGQLDTSLQELLDSDPRLFGMCVAFEPFAFDVEREHFARYVCRRTADDPLSTRSERAEESFQIKFLHPPDYSLYRDWDWYRLPKLDGQAHWSEPYIDTGGGDIPMVTFSSPIRRSGRFVGVVTADLSLEYFRQLKRWLDELQLARGDYGFVISSAGTFISDANPDYQMGRQISEFARPDLDSGYTALWDLIRRQQPGSVKGIDFWTDNRVTFLVAPVPSPGWSFVAVIPEQPVSATRPAPSH